MKRKLLILAFASLCVGAGSFSRTAEAGVCDDRLRFCLAGCTSTSPSNCRQKCYDQYNLCKQIILPGTNPGGGGGTD